MSSRSIAVLVVDDSAVVRVTLQTLLSEEPGIGPVETAADPFIAAERMRTHVPDVIVLDVQMPRMDGLTFLRKLMAQHPIPVVVCSAHVGPGSQAALEALESGAVDLIAKPSVGTRAFLEESRTLVADAVRAAAAAHVVARPASALRMRPSLTADAVIPMRRSARRGGSADRVVAIGASTGGVEALRTVLEALPEDFPGIVIAQHMPAQFTDALARRLDSGCRVSVSEARDGERILPGHVLIAPGDRHTAIRAVARGYEASVIDGPRVNRHRPSVDVLFRSVACEAGQRGIGVLLTGMGDDGAAGLLEMRQAGATTFVQDEATSVVFGMPAAALKIGATDEVLPIGDIAGRLMSAVLEN